MPNPLRIAACGGGTAGHYYPALSVLRAVKEKRDCEIIYFTAAGRIDDINVESDIPEAHRTSLSLKGLSRPIARIENFGILRQHFRQVSHVKRTLEAFRPDFTFSTGGYISYPVIKASKSLGIPVFIHEQNALPGLANRKLAKHTERFFVSFEESVDRIPLESQKIVVSGNPVRLPTRGRDELVKQLGFDPELPFFVVMGGSLGSDMINQLCQRLYDRIEGNSDAFQFLHATGDSSTTNGLHRYSFVRSYDYVNELHDYIAASDCAIARGGATTIAELIRYKTPGIIIPWPLAADNHQYFNALSLANAGLGCVILENAATEEIIYTKLVKNSRRTEKVPDTGTEPAEIIAEYLLRGV